MTDQPQISALEQIIRNVVYSVAAMKPSYNLVGATAGYRRTYVCGSIRSISKAVQFYQDFARPGRDGDGIILRFETRDASVTGTPLEDPTGWVRIVAYSHAEASAEAFSPIFAPFSRPIHIRPQGSWRPAGAAITDTIYSPLDK